MFFKFKEAILNQAPSCGNLLRNDLMRGVPRVWRNYYLMDLDKDIAFEIGRLYYGIRDYNNALTYYIESTRTIGEHHVTFHNQGLCHYSMGRLAVSLDLFKKALSLVCANCVCGAVRCIHQYKTQTSDSLLHD